MYRSPKSSTGKRGTKLDTDGRPVYGETVTVELDRIFSEEEVIKLNAAMKRTARKPFRKGGASHPLSKRLFGACGKHYTGVNRTDRYGRAYRCSGKVESYAGQPRCGCSQVDAEALEARVWGEVCTLLEDPERLAAMAGDWAEMAQRSGVNHEDRVTELEGQIAEQDSAITAAVVMAAKEPDAAAAFMAAVSQLKEERARLGALLEEAQAWRTESQAMRPEGPRPSGPGPVGPRTAARHAARRSGRGLGPARCSGHHPGRGPDASKRGRPGERLVPLARQDCPRPDGQGVGFG